MTVIHQLVRMNFTLGHPRFRNLQMSITMEFTFELTFHENFARKTQRAFQAHIYADEREIRLRLGIDALMFHKLFS